MQCSTSAAVVRPLSAMAVPCRVCSEGLARLRALAPSPWFVWLGLRLHCRGADVAIGMDVEDDEASVSAEAGPSGVARGSAVKKPRTRTRTVGKRNRAAKGEHSAKCGTLTSTCYLSRASQCHMRVSLVGHTAVLPPCDSPYKLLCCFAGLVMRYQRSPTAHAVVAACAGSASTSAADSNNGIDVTDVDGAWQCRHCTYANTDADADVCEVCEQGRYS